MNILQFWTLPSSKQNFANGLYTALRETNEESGLIPIALALEELGFSRINRGNNLLKSKKSITPYNILSKNNTIRNIVSINIFYNVIL